MATIALHILLKWNASLRFASLPRWVDEEMERFGTRLMALNDWGDNSHEGELLKYMKGWVSKGECLKIAERRRWGKLRKAREGRIIGGALQPRYGFEYVRNAEGKAVGYEVDPKKMANVRMIFEMLAGAKACVLYRRSSSRAAS